MTQIEKLMWLAKSVRDGILPEAYDEWCSRIEKGCGDESDTKPPTEMFLTVVLIKGFKDLLRDAGPEVRESIAQQIEKRVEKLRR